MNTNDIAVSVIRVEAADILVVKLAHPPHVQQIENAITQATGGRTNITAASGQSCFADVAEIVGETVLAKLKLEGEFKYRRAVVKSISHNNFSTMKTDTQVKVDFIDDGAVDVVPLASLIPCPESIKKLDPEVRTLQLTNLKPLAWQPIVNPETGGIESKQILSERWEPAANYDVGDLLSIGFFNNNCKAEVLRTDERGVWRGDFHFFDGTKFQSLRRHLIEKGYAREVMTEPPPEPKPRIFPGGPRFGPRVGRPQIAATRGSLNANIMNTYLVCGSKPHPQPLVDSDTRKYCQIVEKVHHFQQLAYHPFVWAAVDMARQIFLTMPGEMIHIDENAISLVLPDLMDTIRVPNATTAPNQLCALFLVPSGPIGSKLFQQLSQERTGLKNKVKFLHSASGDGDASDCQVLVLTPGKLGQFLRNSTSLKMESLKFLSFLFVDELMKNDEDRAVLRAFKTDVARFHQAARSARLFALTKTWSHFVSSFFDEWFKPANPLAYFLDLAEASLYFKTHHSFVHAQRDVLPRCLTESIQKLQQNRHRIAIFCLDDDFEWILSILRQNSITVLPLTPQMAGLDGQLAKEFGNWVISSETQCLLIPDSLLKPEVGLTPHGTVGPSAIIHVVTLKDKTSFRNRFMLMKPTWTTGTNTSLKTESILLLENLPGDLCNYLNDFLERSGSQPSQVIANWASNRPLKGPVLPVKSPKTAAAPMVVTTGDLCTLLLELGKCGEESTCQMRHVFKADLDDCCVETSKFASLSHLKIGGRASFQINHVITGNHFAGILKSPVNSAETMLRIDRELKSSFKNWDNSKKDAPKIGNVYGAVFDHGRTLRRVLVLKDLGICEGNFLAKSAVLKESVAVNSYLVRLVDRGSVEVEIQGNKVFPLSEDLVKEPWQTVEIILCNIRPADRAWPNQVKESLKQKLVGREVEASVALVLRHHIFVTNLVHREVCSTVGNQRATVTDVRTLLTGGADALAAVANPEHLRSLVDKCLGASIHVPPATRQSFTQLQQSDEIAPKNNSPTHTSSILQMRPQKPVTQELEESSLALNEDTSSLIGAIKVRISAVHCPGTFFVQRIDNLDKFSQMERAIAEWVRSDGDVVPRLSSQVLTPKCLCLARLPADQGNCWSRVTIQRVFEQNQTVHVFAVDHGEVETIPIADLRPISVHLASYPKFAIECHLAHVKWRDDFREENFSEEAGEALWNTGLFTDGSSRTFRVRVIDKIQRGFFCKSGINVIEMWPAFELERETPPKSDTYMDLSASGQLIRLAHVLPDFEHVTTTLKLIMFSDQNVNELVNKLLPSILADSSGLVDERFGAWLASNERLLTDLVRENVSAWCQLVDCLVTVMELGSEFHFEMAADLLRELLPLSLSGISEDTSVDKDRVSRVIYGAMRRLLPIAAYYISLALEEVRSVDDIHANDICDLLTHLIPLATSGNDFAQDAVQLCVRSGLITFLMRQACTKPSFDTIPYCFELLSDLIASPVFPAWLRRMNAFKSTQFAATSSYIEKHPWERLATIVQRLVTLRCPTLLSGLLKSIESVMAEDDAFVTIVGESELGSVLKDIRETVRNQAECDGDWKKVEIVLTRINLLLDVFWETNFDPEADSDRFGEKRIRPSYRLPPSTTSTNAFSPMNDPALVNGGNDLFGTILWSQNASTILLQFDNTAIVKANLLAQVIDVDEIDQKQVLRLTIMSAHRSLDVYLFGRVDPDVVIRDKFSGAELKLRKLTAGDWLYLEAPGKRLGNVKSNFDEVDMIWSDDDDEDEEELREMAACKKAMLLRQAPDDQEDGESVGDENNGGSEQQTGVNGGDKFDGTVESVINKVRSQDFPCDDDGFD